MQSSKKNFRKKFEISMCGATDSYKILLFWFS